MKWLMVDSEFSTKTAIKSFLKHRHLITSVKAFSCYEQLLLKYYDRLLVNVTVLFNDTKHHT